MLVRVDSLGKVVRKREVLGVCSRFVDADGCPVLVFDSFQVRSECLDCEFFIPISDRISLKR